jgi:hypothetical protein
LQVAQPLLLFCLPYTLIGSLSIAAQFFSSQILYLSSALF